MKVCNGCGQLEGISQYNEALWDIYYRIDDGRSTYEPLVFTSDWLEENVRDEEDMDSVKLAMERDMVNRGLCPECARPDLRGVDPNNILSEEDAKDLHEMWAEMAAERRMGA
jgi:hypothetical protein